MAEEESELELDRFKKELETLLKTSANDERGLQSKTYCERFCEVRWHCNGRKHLQAFLKSKQRCA